MKPDPTCNPLEDARTLRAAMKGLGTDEDSIINILTKRAHFQRQEIKTEFKNEFGRVRVLIILAFNFLEIVGKTL